MKRNLLLFFAIAGLSFSINAQERFIRTDAGIGGAGTFGDLKSYGISASVEPKFFFTNQIAAGLRFEGDVLFGGSMGNEVSDFDVQMSSRTAILVKGEYYISKKRNRMFVGLMGGRYTQANVGSSSSGSATIKAGNNFGFAPELGVTFNNFRISGIYHVVPGADLVSVSTGEPIEVSKNYFVFQLGFKVFQVDLK